MTRGIGTNPYRAPEVKQGQYDNRSDLHSLGISPKELRMSHRTDDPLTPILEKATARNPDERYQTAEEFQKAPEGLQDK